MEGLPELENQDQSATNSGFMGKVRSSLTKKISFKALAGVAKSPSRRRTSGGENDEVHDHAGEEATLAVDERNEGENEDRDLLNSDVAADDGTGVVTTTTVTVHEEIQNGETGGKKKKTKKKTKTHREVVSVEQVEPEESTPARSSAATLQTAFDESPVATGEDRDYPSAAPRNFSPQATEFVETTEEVVVSSSGKTKKTKTKRKTKHSTDVHEGEAYV